ncbi:scm-like with four MBT domains protein 1 [Aplochiton taeniatus]
MSVIDSETQETNGHHSPESDFCWDEYLEENGVLAVPHHTFKHVDRSLQPGLAPGMKLEVCVTPEPERAYWVATIITYCGQLLLLRYEGYGNDRTADFWCDSATAELHPLGWGQRHGKLLRPPEGLQERLMDWRSVLEEVLLKGESAPRHLLEAPQAGGDPVHLFPQGSCVELQDSLDPGAAWWAEVEHNIGGRLCLHYSGSEGLNLPQARRWLFYLDPFLHPPGWAEENGCTLTPPAVPGGVWSETELEEALKRIQAPMQQPCFEAYQSRPEISPHSFSVGMKLEAVDPSTPFGISPATVTKVLSPQFFLVEMDSLLVEGHGAGQRSAFLCHHGSAEIFPVLWCFKNEVPLSPPPGYQGEDFDWAEYLKQCGAIEAPESCFPVESSAPDFVESMRLEAVNPLSPEHIHVATITKVRGQHIWLRLEGLKQPLPDVVSHVDSMDIFPVGWCESNGHPLQYPSKPQGQIRSLVAVVQPEKHTPTKATPPETGTLQDLSPSDNGNGKYRCSKIYFNHRCFSGPFLNKGRIAELPQYVGPGNCVLVLREALTLLISTGYCPNRVLRELQQDKCGPWQGQGETLKAKYKGRSYRASVGIARTTDQVAEFCRRICVRLECCPNLMGPTMVQEHCSENCSLLTKTKFTHYYEKKKSKNLLVRSPGGANDLESSVKRTRKIKPIFSLNAKPTSASLDSTPAGSPLGSGDDDLEDLDYSVSDEDSGSERHVDSEVSERKSRPPTPTSTSNSSQSHTTRGRPRRQHRKALAPFYSDDENQPPTAKSVCWEVQEKLCLESSPLAWSVADVTRFIRTTECAPLARMFNDQEIDGQAFLLLSLPTVQECMGLKLGPAIKLCHLIERVKLAFYQNFAS